MLIAHENAAALACQRRLGTLIGADLLNIDAVRGLGAPVASIAAPGLSMVFSSLAS
jgi:uncharacterized membrane protein